MTTLRRGRPRRPGERADDGAALLGVLAFLAASAVFLAAILGTLWSELRPTAYERKAGRTINAAEAGVSAGVAALRTATSTSPLIGTYGDVTRLPCASTRPLAGAVGGTGGQVSYSVRIRYYTDDPSNRADAWRSANEIACTGTTGPVTAPRYALLEATGRSTSTGGLATTRGDRDRELVYVFRRTDEVAVGGVIRTGTYTSNGTLCWSPSQWPTTSGDRLVLAPCDPDDPRQTFVYRSDYSLALSVTQQTYSPPAGGLCVSADAVGGTSPADGTGSGNAMVPVGSPVWQAAGPLTGTAVDLSATGSFLRSNRPSTVGGALSAVAWFRAPAGGSGFVLQLSDRADLAGTQQSAQVWVDGDGRLRWGVRVAGGGVRVVPSAGSVVDGAWHHVAVTAGPTGLRLFLDGVEVGSATGDATVDGGSGYWHLGAGSRGDPAWGAQVPAGTAFGGRLAHVAVWPRQLSADEIRAIAGASTPGQVQGAVLTAGPSASWALGGSEAARELLLRTCDGSTPQRWNYDNNHRIQVERFDSTSLSGWCIHAPDSVGATLTAAYCNVAREWSPATTVGAGPAGIRTEQLVNYAEFSRCLDVTNWNLAAAYLIIYPCKQDSTARPGPNQLWHYDRTTGQLFVGYELDPVTGTPMTGFGGPQTRSRAGDPVALHCLTTPAQVDGHVVVRPCRAGAEDQRWTMNGDAGPRARAFTVVDAYGRCLGLGPPDLSAGGLAQFSRARAERCTGAADQKWNAPPGVDTSTVKSERETTGGR